MYISKQEHYPLKEMESTWRVEIQNETFGLSLPANTLGIMDGSFSSFHQSNSKPEDDNQWNIGVPFFVYQLIQEMLLVLHKPSSQ